MAYLGFASLGMLSGRTAGRALDAGHRVSGDRGLRAGAGKLILLARAMPGHLAVFVHFLLTLNSQLNDAGGSGPAAALTIPVDFD